MTADPSKNNNSSAPRLCASCDRCRSRKQKCDGQRPCSNCFRGAKNSAGGECDDAAIRLAAMELCVYSPEKRRGRRSKSAAVAEEQTTTATPSTSLRSSLRSRSRERRRSSTNVKASVETSKPNLDDEGSNELILQQGIGDSDFPFELVNGSINSLSLHGESLPDLDPDDALLIQFQNQHQDPSSHDDSNHGSIVSPPPSLNSALSNQFNEPMRFPFVESDGTANTATVRTPTIHLPPQTVLGGLPKTSSNPRPLRTQSTMETEPAVPTSIGSLPSSSVYPSVLTSSMQGDPMDEDEEQRRRSSRLSELTADFLRHLAKGGGVLPNHTTSVDASSPVERSEDSGISQQDLLALLRISNKESLRLSAYYQLTVNELFHFTATPDCYFTFSCKNPSMCCPGVASARYAELALGAWAFNDKKLARALIQASRECLGHVRITQEDQDCACKDAMDASVVSDVESPQGTEDDVTEPDGKSKISTSGSESKEKTRTLLIASKDRDYERDGLSRADTILVVSKTYLLLGVYRSYQGDMAGYDKFRGACLRMVARLEVCLL